MCRAYKHRGVWSFSSQCIEDKGEQMNRVLVAIRTEAAKVSAYAIGMTSLASIDHGLDSFCCSWRTVHLWHMTLLCAWHGLKMSVSGSIKTRDGLIAGCDVEKD